MIKETVFLSFFFFFEYTYLHFAMKFTHKTLLGWILYSIVISTFCTSLVLFILTQQTTANAEHYIINNHRNTVTTSYLIGNTSRPIITADVTGIRSQRKYIGELITTQSNPGTSCKSIKEQYGYSASSGLYWIDLQPATQVYCDMDTDGGGWLRIGRVITNAQNIHSYRGGSSVMSTNFSDLHKVAIQNHLLDGNRFADLKSTIRFTEYRVYCTKPYHGRTNHAKFTNSNPISAELFNYATSEVLKSPSTAPSMLCNTLVYMSDDTSRTRLLHPCNSLKPSSSNPSHRLYHYIWFVNANAHITV